MVGKTISHFKILEQIGSGGMGIVYKAQDLALDRIVALKSLRPDAADGTKAMARLVEEARTAAVLDHANICTIYEVLQTQDQQVFVAMAYYAGETVYQKLRIGPLAQTEAIAIARDVAAGLAKAHQHGIIHLDIKPGNVMVTRDGVVKILDFGLAKLISAASARGGTMAYMSPEQLRGDRVDERSDVWAWGILLFQMLTRRLPFGDLRGADLTRAILDDPIKLTHSVHTPSGILQVISRALEKNPNNRYSRITEARLDLERCCPPDRAADVAGQSIVKRYTANLKAYNLYLKARYQWNRGSPESLFKSRENLTRATEEDAGYGVAFCALAECYLVMGARALLPPDEAWKKAREAANRALALDSELAEAHGCLGAVLAINDFNWANAGREFRRGLALNPESAPTRHWYAIALLTPLGRFREAVEEASCAVESEPLSLIYNSTLSWIYYLSRQWDLAVVQCGKTLEIDPVHVDSLWCLGTSYRQLGRFEEAAEVLKKLDEVSGGIPLVYGSLGHYHARMGNHAEAERMLAAMQNSRQGIYCSPVCEAWIHANLPGRCDAALDCLQKAWMDRDFMVRYIHLSRALESLFGHPRFQALLDKMDLRADFAEALTDTESTMSVSKRETPPVQGI